MVKTSERVLSEHGSRLRVRAADIEGKPDLADLPERSKVRPPRFRAVAATGPTSTGVGQPETT